MHKIRLDCVVQVVGGGVEKQDIRTYTKIFCVVCVSAYLVLLTCTKL